MEILARFDIKIFEWLNRLVGVSALFDAIVRWCAVYLIYVLIAFVVFDITRRDVLRKRARLSFDFLSLFVTLGSSYGITEMLRDMIDRTRPLWELGATSLLLEYSPSFPSGHTSFVFSLATFLFLLREKRAAYVAYALGVLIGVSRVIAGVHYPVDIVGGALVGIAVAWAVRFVLNRAPRK